MTVAARDVVPPRIRPVKIDDLLEITRLERQCFDQPWPFTAFESHVDAVGFLVAIVDGRVVGFVVGSIHSGFPGPYGHIKDLAVHPAYRRRGIAQYLLTESLDRLATHGAIRAILEVRASNDGAISLYESADFRPARRRPGYYEDGEAAIVMARSL